MTIKIGVVGAKGRMGANIIDLILEDDKLELSAAIEYEGSPHMGEIIHDTNITISNSIADVAKNTDVFIDFTVYDALKNNISIYKTANTPVVIGTTGLEESFIAKMKDQLKHIPVLLSTNTSIGVNVTINLLVQATKMLNESYDIEIIEYHHNKKLDAPSGTAITMAKEICQASERHNFTEDCVYERSSNNNQRRKNEIGLQSVRGGNIIGDHKIMFIGKNDTITISHHAQSRELFAQGAIHIAQWLADKQAGYYTMKDIFS